MSTDGGTEPMSNGLEHRPKATNREASDEEPNMSAPIELGLLNAVQDFTDEATVLTVKMQSQTGSPLCSQRLASALSSLALPPLTNPVATSPAKGPPTRQRAGLWQSRGRLSNAAFLGSRVGGPLKHIRVRGLKEVTLHCYLSPIAMQAHYATGVWPKAPLAASR